MRNEVRGPETQSERCYLRLAEVCLIGGVLDSFTEEGMLTYASEKSRVLSGSQCEDRSTLRSQHSLYPVLTRYYLSNSLPCQVLSNLWTERIPCPFVLLYPMPPAQGKERRREGKKEAIPGRRKSTCKEPDVGNNTVLRTLGCSGWF